MWQVCPLCKGQLPLSDTLQCSVCKGAKIIHEVTGKPPAQIIPEPPTIYGQPLETK